MNFVIRNLFTSWYVMLLIILILSPFDLLPEAIFGIFGLIDDIIMIILLLVIISNIYYYHAVRR